MNVYDYIKMMSLAGITFNTFDNGILTFSTEYGFSCVYYNDPMDSFVYATVYDEKAKNKYGIGEKDDFEQEGPTIELEVFEDFIEKAKAILAGEPYDDRIIVPINMTDEEFLLIAKAAHKCDVTINDFIINAMQQYLENNKATKRAGIEHLGVHAEVISENEN